jgi:antitoxin CptB
VSIVQDQALRRLRWQCRRGLLELDLLFAGFLEQRYSTLNTDEQDAFQRLLELPDQTLLSWIQGQDEPLPELRNIINYVVQLNDY